MNSYTESSAAFNNNAQGINPNLLWKLVRKKHHLTFSLCFYCSRRMFTAKNSNFILCEDGGARANFYLCKKCVEKNMRINDFHGPQQKGSFHNKRNYEEIQGGSVADHDHGSADHDHKPVNKRKKEEEWYDEEF